MRVKILYFAAVRELLGQEEEEIALPTGVETLRALSEHLERRHASLQGQLGHVRFARNETFADLDGPIAEGDVIAVIPPVAGG